MTEIDWWNLSEQDLEKIEKHLPVLAKEIKEVGIEMGSQSFVTVLLAIDSAILES